MKPEHYAQLRAAMLAWMQHHPQVRAEYAAAGLSELRFAWDAAYAARVEGNTAAWICAELYPYLNDEHIRTALRQVVRTAGQLEGATC